MKKHLLKKMVVSLALFISDIINLSFGCLKSLPSRKHLKKQKYVVLEKDLLRLNNLHDSLSLSYLY